MGEPTTDKLAEVIESASVGVCAECENPGPHPADMDCSVSWVMRARRRAPREASAIRAALVDGSLSPADLGMESYGPIPGAGEAWVVR